MGISSMVLPFFLRLLFVYDMNPESGTPVTNAAGVIEYYTDASGAARYVQYPTMQRDRRSAAIPL